MLASSAAWGRAEPIERPDMAHEFFSDDWIAAVESMRDEAPEPNDVVKDVVINLVVTDTPFGERHAHLAGGLLEQGLDDGAPTTMTMPYDAARLLFIDQDQQATTQAFLTGRIKVTGDMMVLMKLQTAPPPTAEQAAFQERIKALTI
ncbi:MAG: SCP-2 sterol transfer family protein [Acidimicrobiaceae bacterium]|nr:SCP-2 sterol transfer family protein [Acidimicrobiaceae bacterium]